MLGDELFVGVAGIGGGGGLPVAIVCNLLDARLRLYRIGALGVLLQELLIGLGGIGRGRGLPVRALTAAARERQSHAGCQRGPRRRQQLPA